MKNHSENFEIPVNSINSRIGQFVLKFLLNSSALDSFI